MSISTTQQSISIKQRLLPELWDICGSYVIPSQRLDFWTALEDPEKGFKSASATIYRLFKEKFDSLPPESPLKNWYLLRNFYQERVLTWEVGPSTDLQDACHVQSISNTRVITGEGKPSFSGIFQYYVCDISEKTGEVLTKIPLGMKTRCNAIAALSSKKFAMVEKAFSSSAKVIIAPIRLWQLNIKKRCCECIATSELLTSPLALEVLPKKRLACVSKDKMIRIFDSQLRGLAAVSIFERVESMKTTPDGDLILLKHDQISVFSLIDSEQSLKVVKIGEYSDPSLYPSERVGILHDGRIVFALNGKNPRLCLWDYKDLNTQKIYPLEVGEYVDSLTILTTGQIACGIRKHHRKYIKIWPPNHSDRPHILASLSIFNITPFSDAGFALTKTLLGKYEIAQPVLNDAFFNPPTEADKKAEVEGFCSIL